MRRGFTIHHNGPPARCIGMAHSRCESFWRAVRAFHTNPEPTGKGWSDIAYSFGMCPHGVRFVGRGWDKHQFANGQDVVPPNDGDDRDWYTVLAFVGGGPGTGHPNEAPTASMLVGLQRLVAEGRDTRRCGLAVKPHNDWKPKPCPGVELTAWSERHDGRPFPALTPPPPQLPQEDDMRIIDCKGRPALIVFGDRTYEPLNEDQRNAWRSAGVEAGLVTIPERDIIVKFLTATP